MKITIYGWSTSVEESRRGSMSKASSLDAEAMCRANSGVGSGWMLIPALAASPRLPSSAVDGHMRAF